MNGMEKLLVRTERIEINKSEKLSSMILTECFKLAKEHKDIIFDNNDLFQIQQNIEFTATDVERAVYKHFYIKEKD